MDDNDYTVSIFIIGLMVGVGMGVLLININDDEIKYNYIPEPIRFEISCNNNVCDTVYVYDIEHTEKPKQ